MDFKDTKRKKKKKKKKKKKENKIMFALHETGKIVRVASEPLLTRTRVHTHTGSYGFIQCVIVTSILHSLFYYFSFF